METEKKISRLNPLIGTWAIEGKNLSAAPESAATPVTGVQKVKVMEGGKFLESHWEYDFGPDKHIGLSVIGIPNDAPRPKIFSFDNAGFYRAYDLEIEGHLWKIKGETERASMEFENNNSTYNEFWEIKVEDTWRPLCRRTGNKKLE